MSIERARAHLAKYGLEDRIRELTVSSATVALAAEALGCEPARIAKTLSFENGEGAILVIAAGDARIDNAKFKHRFGMKAHMLSAERVEPLIGHGVGGVCPFGIHEGIPVYLDESLKRFDIVYPAAGTAASAVMLTLSELERASEADGWVDVTK
ncbi:MAG: YbaK/EbsC family protein [Clostridiales bacterium]|nr:YbaK/EbsC family protein [Clostridiales bacterium]MDY3763273.1 YbaK/EbsC family protein [Candidatus Ventricola sp.]MCI6589284.1 YbaK/EbsC family protein [Clostridiales bacterium]MDY3831053.1 YbaK/EbsC family protein [Candidatus Ventricola sp.]MDY4541970.1 YbaK/EbsC family protein [Candidatus Ventricola sp.]